ncbi:MAG: hypothetical protein SVY10_06010 [Thermodesulfobacteriota bacterium]|nr:hypothetical protein [Thermodesulfobacteriota bacterium]
MGEEVPGSQVGVEVQVTSETEAELPTLKSIADSVDAKSVDLDTVWVLIAAILVMFMQPGFALLEAGFTRAKNACNIDVDDKCPGVWSAEGIHGVLSGRSK